MSRRPATVTQAKIKRVTKAKVERVVKGVVDAGVAVARVEVDKDDRIIVIAGRPGEHTGVEATNDLDAWITKHADPTQGH
jgi:hypothetical protein